MVNCISQKLILTYLTYLSLQKKIHYCQSSTLPVQSKTVSSKHNVNIDILSKHEFSKKRARK